MARAVRLRADGASPEIIGATLGVSATTLRARFKEIEGVTLSSLSRGSVLVNEAKSDDERRAGH